MDGGTDGIVAIFISTGLTLIKVNAFVTRTGNVTLVRIYRSDIVIFVKGWRKEKKEKKRKKEKKEK